MPIVRPCILGSVGAICLGVSTNVAADALIPYMVVPWGQLFLLPVIVLIEASILYALLGGTLLRVAFQSLVANLASTVLGCVLYVATSPLIGHSIFEWWFKGDFASERVRNACLAFLFAAALWVVSWSTESWVVARMRKVQFSTVSGPCAWANLATYVLLFALALWFQK